MTTPFLFSRIGRGFRIRGQSGLKINPLRLASFLSLSLSPLLTWITIVSVVIYQNVVVFGVAAQSNLLMVSSSQLGTNISPAQAFSATASSVLLVVAGFAMLKSSRFGVPLAAAGLITYVIAFLTIFGSYAVGFEQTFVSPGIGVFVAGAGVLLGFASAFARPIPISEIVVSLKTRRGLAYLGASFASFGLALDILNHSVLGQFAGFVGLTLGQQVLHLGLVLGVALIAVVVLLNKLDDPRFLLIASGATLALLAVDALSALYVGNLHDFLGHNLTETLLHFSVYYGVALSLVGGLLGSS